MVNLGKRMRKLQPLLSIRSGAGAAILPTSTSSTQPILTHIHLRYPYGPFDTAVHGARLFWRNHLRRLKYHNPALPVTVEHEAGHLGSPMTLRLTFEGTDVDALRAVAKKSESPKAVKREEKEAKSELMKAVDRTAAEKQSPNFKNAPGKPGQVLNRETGRWVDASTATAVPAADASKAPQGGNATEAVRVADAAEAAQETVIATEGPDSNSKERIATDITPPTTASTTAPKDLKEPTPNARTATATMPSTAGPKPLSPSTVPTANDDEVVLKTPQPEDTPAPIYTRNVTLGVKDRNVRQIWYWFQQRTGCVDVPRTAADDEKKAALSEVFIQSAQDRQRVKKGVDARKANDQMLKRARGEVEKLRAET